MNIVSEMQQTVMMVSITMNIDPMKRFPKKG